jgi:UDP-GlcNAc:undecaprenyl-phosphate/decaprenyl-phosphate GlcNAc-1-phosphate transferase
MVIWAVGSLIIASVFAGALTFAVKAIAFRRNWLGQALPHHFHDGPIPRLGGVSIFLTVVVSAFCLQIIRVPWTIDLSRLLIVFLGGALVFGIGLWDDFSPISPAMKAILEVVAALVLYAGHFRIESLPPIANSLPPYLSLLLTVLWVLGVTNAFNLIDGLDGLAAGSAFISSVTLGILFTVAGHPEYAVLSLVIAGALAGFLKFNFSPAVIFLGDCGSLFVGFLMSALGLVLFKCISSPAVTLIPLLAFGLPVLDTILAIVRRVLKKQPIYMPDCEHMHHQLIARGFSVPGAALLLYGISAFFCAVGVLLVSMPNHLALLLTLPIGCSAGCSVGFGYYNRYVPDLQQLSRVETRAQEAKNAKLEVESTKLAKRRKSLAVRHEIEHPELSTVARGAQDRHATGVAFSDD